MCWVAEAPPTAPREPDACREPAVERAERLAFPGMANKEERLSNAVDVVRNPAAERLATSAGVKAVLATVEDVGLAFITDIYLSTVESV